MLSLAGVPGVYVHSLLGSRSWREGVEKTGRYRTINREKLEWHDLAAALADPTSLRHRVFYQYTHLLRIRSSQGAFHPNGVQRIFFGNRALFTLLRSAPDAREQVLCVHNVSDEEQDFRVDLNELGVLHGDDAQDLVFPARYPIGGDGQLGLTVKPYQVLWLKV
jgi:sucrose phosphorylase